MNKLSLLSFALATSLLGTIALPALSSQPSQFIQSTANEVVTIPASSAIVVAFPQGVQLDVDQSKNYPLTLPLVMPIVDRSGNAIVPANSLVSVQLVASDKGVTIVAKSLIIGGQVVPIQAFSEIIPTENVVVKSGTQNAQEQADILKRIGASTSVAIKGDLENVNKGTAVGNIIGLIIGRFSPKKVKVVTISPGSKYILTLQTSIDVSAIPAY